VETYVVRLNTWKPTLKQRALSVLLLSSMYFALMFAWKFFWPSPYERREGLYGVALEVAIVSLIWGMGMAFWPKKISTCKLLVDERSITSVIEYTGWMKWLVLRKTVSAGKVRIIREVKGRLGAPGGFAVSERSEWGARMWGRVFIPKTLPEYEELKALVESWRARE
jgi:hypothetical protein